MGNVLCPHFWVRHSPEAMERDIEKARGIVELLEETSEKTEKRFKKALDALRKNRTPSNLRAVRLVEQAAARDARSLSVAKTYLEHIINIMDGLLTDGAIEATMGQLEDAARAVPPRLDKAAKKLERSEYILDELVGRGGPLAEGEDDASLDEDIDELLGKYDPKAIDLMDNAPAVPAPKKKIVEREEEEPRAEDPFKTLRQEVEFND